jgi:hypothetical protein
MQKERSRSQVTTPGLKNSVKTPTSDKTPNPPGDLAFAWIIRLHSHFLCLRHPSTVEFYVVIYFFATAIQDAVASFSVGLLEIVLTSIFVLYGLDSGYSAIAALLVRSISFWFPLFVGFLAVQYMGTKNLISQLAPKRRLTKKLDP